MNGMDPYAVVSLPRYLGTYLRGSGPIVKNVGLNIASTSLFGNPLSYYTLYGLYPVGF